MPYYVYRCANHHRFERFLSVREHDSAVSCEQCDLVAQQVITAPLSVRVKRDICYTSPIDDTLITSWYARQEDLRRHDCVAYDPGMKQDKARRKREAQDSFEAGIDQTVGEAIARMPTAKRDLLKREVVNQGLDLAVSRDAC